MLSFTEPEFVYVEIIINGKFRKTKQTNIFIQAMIYFLKVFAI